jgi:hypothetical protein
MPAKGIGYFCLILFIFSVTNCITINGPKDLLPGSPIPKTVPPVTLPAQPSVTQPVAKPVINYFSVNPPIVDLGKTSILSWSVSNSELVRIDNNVRAVPSTSSIVITPRESQIFTLTASNEGGSVTSTTGVTVLVSGSPVVDELPLIQSFTAWPYFLYPGESSTLRWIVSNATEVTIDNEVGIVVPVGFMSVKPAVTTTYTLKASNGLGSRSRELIVFKR